MINVNKKKIFKSLYMLLVLVGLSFGVLNVVKYKDGLSFLYFLCYVSLLEKRILFYFI